MRRPRSAYIHVPFCRHRCGYCNFTLVSGRDDLIPAYLDALNGELQERLETQVPVDTIFVGGGTPSHLAPNELKLLLEILSRWFALQPGGEYSCEVNPLDCTDQHLELLRGHGVNRISLGGQSFNDEKLKTLERDHTGVALQAAIERCARLFPNVSLDLIFAAPGESLLDWQTDVARAIEGPIAHLSSYGLTIERGSAFYGRMLKSELNELPSELQRAMYEHVIDSLIELGWQHYEVSNFARPGYHCRHNEAYWLGQPWWGFGPGAASFEAHAENHCFVRTVNHRSTTTYIRKQQSRQAVVAESEVISLEDHIRERLVFGLRRLAGVKLVELDRVWGKPVQELFEPFLSNYVDQGWMIQAGESLQLTRAGLLISDSLWPDLLSP
jgi:oxygen-independent coproporphyrinogen-3 oxidase